MTDNTQRLFKNENGDLEAHRFLEFDFLVLDLSLK